MKPLRILFDLRRPVSRVEYALATVAVLAGWHAVASAAYALVPEQHTEWTFLSTFEYVLTQHDRLGSASSLAVFFGCVPLFGVPFRWLLFSLAARRARDAGFHPGLAVITLLPILGDLLTLVGVALPTRNNKGIPPIGGPNAAPLQLLLVASSCLFTVTAVVGMLEAHHALSLGWRSLATRAGAAAVAAAPFAIVYVVYRGSVHVEQGGDRAIRRAISIALGAFSAILSACAPDRVAQLYGGVFYFFGGLIYLWGLVGAGLAGVLVLVLVLDRDAAIGGGSMHANR